MSLQDVYSKQVSGNTITNLSVGSSAPIIERDPNINQLERNVFAQLASVIPVEQTSTAVPDQTIASVSFEDALRELAQIKG
jgi:hypothetical protein